VQLLDPLIEDLINKKVKSEKPDTPHIPLTDILPTTPNNASLILKRGIAAGKTPLLFDNLLHNHGLSTQAVLSTRALLSQLLVERSLTIYNMHRKLSLQAPKPQARPLLARHNPPPPSGGGGPARQGGIQEPDHGATPQPGPSGLARWGCGQRRLARPVAAQNWLTRSQEDSNALTC
jgi:hypothetical protein